MRPRLVPELICSCLQESLRFYCDVLQFRVLYERPADRFAYLDLAGAELMLEQPLSRDRLWPRAELLHPYGRGLNLEISVDDVLGLHARVAAAGLTAFLPIEERWYRRQSDEIRVRQFAVSDPDGYLVRLSQELEVRPIGEH